MRTTFEITKNDEVTIAYCDENGYKENIVYIKGPEFSFQEKVLEIEKLKEENYKLRKKIEELESSLKDANRDLNIQNEAVVLLRKNAEAKNEELIDVYDKLNERTALLKSCYRAVCELKETMKDNICKKGET